MPLRLTVNGRSPRILNVHVPILLGGTMGRINVDGDLSDWPLTHGNAAGEFHLVGRRGRKDEGVARWPTTVFAGRDANMLYLAFRCTQPLSSALIARPENTVRYEGLLPTGEDLVEVVLDPGGRERSGRSLPPGDQGEWRTGGRKRSAAFQ